MRDLTEEELKLAPEWADRYYIFEKKGCINQLTYIDSINMLGATDYYTESTFEVGRGSLTFEGSMPIRKPFDITKHEFSDEMSDLKAMLSERGDVVIRIGASWIFLDKPDAIAIAKALGVTAKDLP